MYELSVKNLEIYAFHGVPKEERVIGHRYRISLSMLVDGHADASDLVTETVDYGAAALLAEQCASSGSFFTIERLAAEIGSKLLGQFARIEEIEVVVEKLLPPAPIIAESASVRMRLRRQNSSEPPAFE